MTLEELAKTCASLQKAYAAEPSDELRRAFNRCWESAMSITTHIEFFAMVCNEVNRLEKLS